MDATTPRALLADASANSLLRRLWHDHLRKHRGRLLLLILLTAVMAGLTGLYPVVIDRAFSMFAAKDQRILYQVPILVVAITAAKAAATYGQTVLTQSLVLRTIRELQARMFAVLTEADLSRVERESPAQLAARFTTDAAIIREALTRAVGGLANGITVVGLIASMLWLDWVLSVIAACLYPARRPADSAHRQAHPPRLGRHAGTDGRGGKHADRELHPGPHRARLPARGGGERPGVRCFRAAQSRADAHDALTLLGGSDARSAGRRGRCGRDGLCRLAGGNRQQHGRQLHRLRGRAAHRLPAAAGARLAECGRAGGDGWARARVRRHRRAARHHRAGGRDRVAGGERPRGV